MARGRKDIARQLAATALGGVLLVAGLLKASSSFSALYHFGAVTAWDSFAQTALLGLAMAEVGFATVLTQRPSSPRAWGAALVLFAAFFVVAVMQARGGQQVCDCFGALLVKSRYTAGFDFLAMCIAAAALLSLRGQSTEQVSHAIWAPLFVPIAAFLLAFGGLLFLRESRFLDARYGVAPVVAKLQLEETSSGSDWLSGTALLASRGARPIHVVGCLRSCGLQFKRPLPFDIEPTTFTRLPLLIRRPTHARVGVAPLTIFVEVDGAMQKLTLPLQTPPLR